MEQTLKLRANDTEATELRGLIAAGRSTSAQKAANGFEPTTRLRRTYSEASFRQAAFQLDQVRALRLATLPAAQQAAEYTQLGQDYLAQGLLPEAEQEFQTAIAVYPASAPAHAGLAQVRQQSGSDDEAREEAQSSLRLAPNAAAYIVLAKLELKKNDTAAAAQDVQGALRLDPKNGAALGLRQQLQAKGQALP